LTPDDLPALGITRYPSKSRRFMSSGGKRRYGRYVACLDLPAGDQENNRLGDAGTEIKTQLLWHAAILAPGFRVSDLLGDISGIGQLPHSRQERQGHQGHQGNHLSGCRPANRRPSGRRSLNRPLVAGKPRP